MKTVTLESKNSGPVNMERDVRLLDLAESGIGSARVYDWDGPWVSLGRSQRPDRALLPGCPVPSVPRPTGGKAVLHGHDVTIGLAMPLDAFGLSAEGSRSVIPVYRCIVSVLVEALKACGVRAELGENVLQTKASRHTADCFAHVSPNDIVDPSTGQKICGCALKVTHRAVLVQASVPAKRPLVDPSTVFQSPSVSFWTAVDASGLAHALEEALRRTVTLSAVTT